MTRKSPHSVLRSCPAGVRAGGIAVVVLLAAFGAGGAPVVSVDFGREIGKMRPELHSSGFGPLICSFSEQAKADVKAMGFKAARTHDWALINPNQRVCDWHHVFPLKHLDATRPENYRFNETDYLLKRTREEMGLDVFFRLGTSIEHSGAKVHFNSLIPEDFDKVAEVFAATVRHYNRGWANGHRWGIKYWEIWNEPDGVNNMWCLPEGDEGDEKTSRAEKDKLRQEKFCAFFVKVLKRLKGEFGDEIKVGGPALCGMKPAYFAELLAACKAAGVAPDFISWHHYADTVDTFRQSIQAGRKLCDENGLANCELIVNEWHYFPYNRYDWYGLRSSDPQIVKHVWEGPHAHNGIDSAVFTLSVLAYLQTSALDQAYYYGCRHVGAWGFKDEHQRKYKVFYALKLFGDFLRDHPVICDYRGRRGEAVSALAAKSADGRRKGLLVMDLCREFARGGELRVAVKGLGGACEAKATALDDDRNLEPAACAFKDGELVLQRVNPYSSAFFVAFEDLSPRVPGK